jgi:hypothetical protein
MTSPRSKPLIPSSGNPFGGIHQEVNRLSLERPQIVVERNADRIAPGSCASGKIDLIRIRGGNAGNAVRRVERFPVCDPTVHRGFEIRCRRRTEDSVHSCRRERRIACRCIWQKCVCWTEIGYECRIARFISKGEDQTQRFAVVHQRVQTEPDRVCFLRREELVDEQVNFRRRAHRTVHRRLNGDGWNRGICCLDEKVVDVLNLGQRA